VVLIGRAGRELDVVLFKFSRGLSSDDLDSSSSVLSPSDSKITASSSSSSSPNSIFGNPLELIMSSQPVLWPKPMSEPPPFGEIDEISPVNVFDESSSASEMMEISSSGQAV
jgi:hypothetical protein